MHSTGFTGRSSLWALETDPLPFQLPSATQARDDEVGLSPWRLSPRSINAEHVWSSGETVGSRDEASHEMLPASTSAGTTAFDAVAPAFPPVTASRAVGHTLIAARPPLLPVPSLVLVAAPATMRPLGASDAAHAALNNTVKKAKHRAIDAKRRNREAEVLQCLQQLLMEPRGSEAAASAAPHTLAAASTAVASAQIPKVSLLQACVDHIRELQAQVQRLSSAASASDSAESSSAHEQGSLTQRKRQRCDPQAGEQWRAREQSACEEG